MGKAQRKVHVPGGRLLGHTTSQLSGRGVVWVSRLQILQAQGAREALTGYIEQRTMNLGDGTTDPSDGRSSGARSLTTDMDVGGEAFTSATPP